MLVQPACLSLQEAEQAHGLRLLGLVGTLGRARRVLAGRWVWLISTCYRSAGQANDDSDQHQRGDGYHRGTSLRLGLKTGKRVLIRRETTISC